MDTTKKYQSEQEAVAAAQSHCSQYEKGLDVIYCPMSRGWYIETAPAFVRTWERMVCRVWQHGAILEYKQ